jgi:tRNA1Val (adenine37-N6)-methyltransferase
MKVCTDSCILGAWSAGRLMDAKKILDIGTGTGLLPLMLAQKSGVLIDTIETDGESVIQAGENIAASPWHDRIRILKGDVRYYSFGHRYNFIITNPPFYESVLRSPTAKKNEAKHEQSLTLDQLLMVIRSCLHQGGAFSILLPFQRTTYFEKLAENSGFYAQEKLTIRQTPAHSPFRSILLFSTEKKGKPLLSELLIKNEKGKYSLEFSELMNDYYS